MAKRKEKKDAKKGVHAEALERYKIAEGGSSDSRQLALTDMKFRAGDHWPAEVKKKRKNRPTLVVDKINQYIRQVVNDGRQNRPGVKVRPVDDGGDAKVAKAFQGLIRSICAESNADEAFDTALDSAATCGFGYFRVLTDYADDSGFEQEIEVRRIRNPLAVMLDPTAQMADGSDAEYGFVIDSISKVSFERQFPDAECVDWKTDSDRYAEGWVDEHTVRICEYWYKEVVTKVAYLLENGATAFKDDYAAAANAGISMPAVVREREVKDFRVKWCRLSGAEVLEERDWAGKYIPIIPVYGSEYDIDGKVTYCGLVRPAMDAQRLYNYSRSAFAERVALTPKSPWVAAAGQIEDHPEWATANTEAHDALTYTPQEVGGTILPPPQRVSAADIPAGFAQDMQISEHDIQAAIGMYSASVGAPSNEKSGRAIMARQREGDTATFHYQDNLNRAVRHLGRILVDLIPKVYDSKRVVRLLGEDGEPEMAQIDPNMEVAHAKVDGVSIFNLGAGKYDVDVSAGPSYTTKRQEAADAMIEMTRANPNAWLTHGDLVVKSQDWPGAEEFAKRSRAVMPPELKAAIAQEEQDEDGPSPEVRAISEQAQQIIQQAEQHIQELASTLQERDKRLSEIEDRLQASELAVKMGKDDEDLKREELGIKAFEAKTHRMQAKAALIEKGLPALEDGGDMEAALVEPIDPAILMLVRAMQENTQALAQGIAAAITAPRVGVPQRDEMGRITHIESVVQH